MSKELLQQALELAMRCPWSEERAKLADTLRSALAAPLPEPCYCDRMGIGVPGVSCGDCPRDYKPAPAAPRPDEFTCPYCFDQGAAPVVREPLTREQQTAIREAHCNTASDEYFGARPQVDDATKRRIYEAGFKEGWESGIGGGGK